MKALEGSRDQIHELLTFLLLFGLFWWQRVGMFGDIHQLFTSSLQANNLISIKPMLHLRPRKVKCIKCLFKFNWLRHILLT